MYLSMTKLSPAQVLEDGWRMSENQAFSEKERKCRKMPTRSTSLTIRLCPEWLPGHTAPFPARQRVYPMTVSKAFKTSVPQPHVPEGKKAKGHWDLLVLITQLPSWGNKYRRFSIVLLHEYIVVKWTHFSFYSWFSFSITTLVVIS